MNNEAESLVLAGILGNPEAYWSINDVGLSAEDFLGVGNRNVMRAIDRVVKARKTPELPHVLEMLRLDNDDTAVEYIKKLQSLGASTAQAKEYARTVKGLSVSRQLVQVSARIAELAREKRADAEAVMSEAEAELRRVRSTLPMPDRSPDPADILLRLRSQPESRSIPLRFSPTLQSLTGGLHPGHLWVIGGFSSTGKSAVLINLIADSLRERKWVGLFSVEMTQEQYAIRLLSLLSGIPQRALRDRAVIGLDQHEALRKAESAVARAPMRIYDTVYRLGDIRTKAIQMKETEGLDVLCVDYIQNVHGGTGDEVSDARAVTIELQLLAKELDCTVIALSQVSNEMAKYQAEGGSLNYYAFRGSGAIKDAADFAILLKRDRAARSPLLDMHVVKNRHGEMAVIQTEMDLPTGRITELPTEEDAID